MSLSDIPDVHKILINLTFGSGLAFQKFTGNSPNMGNLAVGDYIIYISGTMSSAYPSASSGLFVINDVFNSITINHAFNITAGVTMPFSYSVMLNLNSDVSNFTPSLTLIYDVSNTSNSTNSFNYLTWWIAKVL
jgi:hypothetical protein